jgi:hypothetical protein
MTRKINRRRFIRNAALTGASVWLVGRDVPARGAAAEDLTVAEFEKLHKALQPPADELWSTIPWKMEIVEACNQAAKEKKPVLMRCRSGHPLGCV